MSGSFWKFNQDYSIESPVTKLLNNAFIRLDAVEEEEEEDFVISSNDELTQGTEPPKFNVYKKANTTTLASKDGPTTEEDLKNYRPNLDIVEELLDDDELYMELMCSNFKLLAYLKYPEVLQVLIDYVTSESVLNSDDYGSGDGNADRDLDSLTGAEISTSQGNNEKDKTGKNTVPSLYSPVPEDVQELNRPVIIVAENNSISEPTVEDKISEGYEEIDRNPNYSDDENNEPNGSQNGNSTEGYNGGENHDSDSGSESDSSSDLRSVSLSQDNTESAELRRARVAAEILSADIWPITSSIIEHRELLEQLWSIMDHPPTLPVMASTYFMKISERLLDMDITGMLQFILSDPNCVDRFLRHIENPPLMDFLLKVISTDKSDSQTGVINELKRQNLISKLLDRLDSAKYDSSVQSAAGDFLKALVTLSANSNSEITMGIGPNELTRQLVSKPMVEKLIKIMLKGGTSLSNAVGIIIEIIRKNNSDYDFVQVMYTTLKTHPPHDRDPIHLIHLIKSFAEHMPDFSKLLNEISLPALETTFGEIEPLGFERFKICELIAELLHCSNMSLLNEANGEAVVKERDEAREKYLNSLDVTDRPEEEEKKEQDDETKPADEFVDAKEETSVSEKIGLLKIESCNGDPISPSDEKMEEQENSDAANNNDDTTIPNDNDNEVYPEDRIDNSEDTELELRRQRIPGDLLKMFLKDTGIIRDIIDMFFKFRWNNFLHNVVFDIVQQIFNGPLKAGYNKYLLLDLLKNSKLTEKLLEGDRLTREFEATRKIRLGYMGHLTLMAEEVAKFVEYIDEMKLTFTDPAVMDALYDTAWKEYMETTLADIRDKCNTVLGDFPSEQERVINGDEDVSIHEEEENNHPILAEGDVDYEINDGQIRGEYEGEDGQVGNLLDDTHYTPKYPGDELDDTSAENAGDDGSNEDYYIKNGVRVYEYIDPSGNKTILHLDDEDDNDGEYGRAASGVITGGEKLSGNSPIPSSIENDINSANYHDPTITSHMEIPEDDDEYIDPHDDGQSYAKPHHPLYNGEGPGHTTIHVNNGDHLAVNGDDYERNTQETEDVYLGDSEGGFPLHRTSSREHLYT